MTSGGLKRIRKGKEVLNALKEYGPLTRKTLSEIVPSIKDDRNFRRTLARLSDKNLISKRFEYINGGQATVYQLNQNSGVRDILATYLGCQSVDLEQKEFRYRELYHEQVSASLAFQLKCLFPEANVYRDFQLLRDPRLKQILSQLENVDSARPDVLLVFWNSMVGRVAIAFEFERAAKAKNRLQHKLRSYCTESRLDGVLYIGSSDQIISNLQEIYRERVLEKSNRIRFYGNNFLLCSTLTGNMRDSLSVCLNAEMKTLKFADWVRVLLQTKDEDRRNSLFS
jgi:hypothetical protein